MSEKENTRTLDSYMAEFRNVLANPESISVDDLGLVMQNVYEAMPLANNHGDPAVAEELANIIAKLNTLMSEKKKIAEENKKVDVVPHFTQMQQAEPSTTPITPVVDSSKEPAHIGEAEVKSYVSNAEVTREELANEHSHIGNIPAERVIPPPVREEDNVTPVVPVGQMKPAPQLSEHPVKEQKMSITPSPVQDQSPVKEEEKKPDITIETPETQENIIVSKDDDEDKPSDTVNVSEEYTEPKLTPFEGDDDLDKIVLEDQEESKDEIVTSKKELESDEAERIKKLDEEYNQVPEGMGIQNVKTISRSKISDTLKALSKLNTKNLNLSNLEMFDFDYNDDHIRQDYIKTRNDMIGAPKISRVALLMSGHYEEISAYGNYDLVSIQRNIYNPSMNFYDKERLLIDSIYKHVQYVSYKDSKPSFDEWAKNIMYPDIQSLYYAVYDANSVGDNSYTFDCPYCGNEMSVVRKNSELSVAVPKDLTKERLDEFITTKEVFSLDSTDIAKWAKTTKIRKRLKNTNIIVEYGVPTLYEYLQTIATLNRIALRGDLGPDFDISIIDGTNVTEDNEDDFMRIMIYLYIKDIGIPVRIENSNKFRYIKLSSKADIIEHVNKVDFDDYRELYKGKDITDLMVRTATRYYLRDCKCDNCKKDIKYISINPKQIFFFKIGEERSRLMS